MINFSILAVKHLVDYKIPISITINKIQGRLFIILYQDTNLWTLRKETLLNKLMLHNK